MIRITYVHSYISTNEGDMNEIEFALFVVAKFCIMACSCACVVHCCRPAFIHTYMYVSSKEM